MPVSFWTGMGDNIQATKREYQSTGFPTRYNTNRPVQSQKKVKILKFWVEIEEEFVLCSYCKADLGDFQKNEVKV